MPTGPKGQKRPADVISNAVKMMRIATGQVEEASAAEDADTERGRKGGKARAAKLTDRQLAEIAHATA